MTRKLIVALAALVLAAFALTACGGDDDDGDGEDTGAATTTETDTGAAAGGGGGGAGGGGGTIMAEADPGGDLAYTTGALSTDTGEVTVEFDNPSSTPHDVRIEDPNGNEVGGTDVITGETTSATVDLSEPGEYVYYCSVDAHREAGMEEPLEVE